MRGHVNLLSIFFFASGFHCMASLGNLAFAVSSYGIRIMHAYEWLSMLFYITFLLVLGRSQGRYMVSHILLSTGLKR
jgi:hypothetical protein